MFSFVVSRDNRDEGTGVNRHRGSSKFCFDVLNRRRLNQTSDMTAVSSRVLICQVVADCSFSMVFRRLTGIIRWIWRLTWLLVVFSAQRYTIGKSSGGDSSKR
ncbi:hypothetical protein Hanom_Chr11g01014391 [Helianthus anomalus]